MAGRIGSSLEAAVVDYEAALVVRPRLADKERFERYWDELRYVFIVSQVRKATEGELEGGSPILTQFKIEPAQGEKCERCWNYSTRVGESARYPTVCERCLEALEEIEKDKQLS